MKKNIEISERIIERLPKYYRALGELVSRDIKKISSKEISELLNITASQVRQDLSHFGDFGQQGYGYDTQHLLNEIKKILGLTREFSMIIVGVGKVGSALAAYEGFSREGFLVKGLFDKRPDSEKGIRDVAELEEFLQTNTIDIAVIAVKKQEAEALSKHLFSKGIKTFWNFAPLDLAIEGAVVENINMSESLFKLAYRANKNN